MSPRQQRSVVVLPAPFGPSNPKQSPRRISNDEAAHDFVSTVALAQALDAQYDVVASDHSGLNPDAVTTGPHFA